ncbi:hypothetical protein D3C71_1861200 [compost metagenome]
MAVLADIHMLVVGHGFAAVAADGDRLVVFDLFAAVVSNEGGFVVIDVDVLVALRMHENLFLIALVFKAQFVVALALVGLAFDRHARLVTGQFVRR